MEQITQDNVFKIEVSKLALDSRFGSLIFDNADKKLSKAQAWLKEVCDLKYSELLLQEDINRINSFLKRIIEHLEWLRQFDIGTVTNVKQEHDNFEQRVDSFYNEVYLQVLMRILPFLREERRRENPDQQKLDGEVKKIVQVRTDLESELKRIKEETQSIRMADKAVGSAKGERAAVRMAVYFIDETSRYEALAKYWLRAVIGGYAIVIGILIWIGIMTTRYINQIITSPTSAGISILWSAVAVKLAVFAALWYGLSFIIKNYNVNSQLAAVNHHRAAVARTLEDFIAVEEQQKNPRLSEVLKNATDAMFKHTSIGFVSKTEKESSGPVLQVVNDLMGLRNGN